MAPTDSDTLRATLREIERRIDAAAVVSGRTGDDVAVLAAVKYIDAPTTLELLAAGVHDLAENRLTQLEERRAAVAAADLPAADAPTWHYIGRLQSRQAPGIAALVDCVHTLTSQRAAERIAAAARDGHLARVPRILVQVNVADDPAKDGLQPDEVDPFLDALPEPVHVSGFMTMPAFAADPEASRGSFARLRELRDRLAPVHSGRHDLTDLSMGTSQDVVVAVEEGATHVRLGRILVGGGE